MKKFITLLLIFSVSIAYAQKKSIFIRLYDLKGKKVYRGNVYMATDTSLLFEVKKQFVTIPVSTIGYIKTKHSAGNNLLIGSVAGATTFAIIGAASADPDDWLVPETAAEGAAGGALIGAGAGAIVGGITILFKNSKTFMINGDLAKWKTFQLFIQPFQTRK